MTMLDPIAPIDPFVPARRAFVERLPGHFQRLGWSPDQVVAHQTAALRRLLRCAVAHSPFRARRIAELVGDVEAFELAHLDRLPVMTKGEMMEHYDDLTTDRRLTRVSVEAFLARVGDDPEALFGEYVVLASGGSSGVRGVFAWHLDLVPDYLSAIRLLDSHAPAVATCREPQHRPRCRQLGDPRDACHRPRGRRRRRAHHVRPSHTVDR